MTDKLWKKVEREIAKLIGGIRVPVSGRQRGDKPDIQHDIFSVEVKHRESLPDWLVDALDQAEKSKQEGQIPVVFLHQKGMKYEDSLTVLRLKDLVDLYRLVDDLTERLD